METEEISKKLEEQDKKLENIYRSVEKTRKYFLWTLIITVVTIFIPLIALAFIIPWFLHIMSSAVVLE
jgi:CHASE3 domain sensor protein